MRTAPLRNRWLLVRAVAFVVCAVFWTNAAPAAEALDQLVRAVVGVQAVVPSDARTAETLGTERVGSGIFIDDKGHVLTIGYLILEADRVEIEGPDGEKALATVVGYDHNTGFGLLRSTKTFGIKPVRLGDSSALVEGKKAFAVSHGGPRPIMPVIVVSRRDFAGYWEYLLEGAIFTSPPHLHHSGAALFGEDGALLGVGSLILANAFDGDPRLPGNMFVPIDALKPIIEDLKEKGRAGRAPQPWVGVYTNEAMGRLFVTRTATGGPAEKAGLKPGDIIMGVGGKRVKDQADFLRKMWAQGEAGVPVPLDILRLRSDSPNIETVVVPSLDRSSWLKVRRGL